MPPSPGPIKIGHKKDDHWIRPHRFYVYCPPPPGRWIRYCIQAICGLMYYHYLVCCPSVLEVYSIKTNQRTAFLNAAWNLCSWGRSSVWTVRYELVIPWDRSSRVVILVAVNYWLLIQINIYIYAFQDFLSQKIWIASSKQFQFPVMSGILRGKISRFKF